MLDGLFRTTLFTAETADRAMNDVPFCACGCGDVVYRPVDPVNYSIKVSRSGVTVRPSVGNWGVSDAHYLITDGEVEWASRWSPEQIAASRAREDARRAAHYASPKRSIIWKLLDWIVDLLRLR